MPLRAALAVPLIVLAGSALAAERQRALANPCASHGPGFQMLPGTTTCLRVSGHVRGEADLRSSRSHSSDRTPLNAEARATLDGRADTGSSSARR